MRVVKQEVQLPNNSGFFSWFKNNKCLFSLFSLLTVGGCILKTPGVSGNGQATVFGTVAYTADSSAVTSGTVTIQAFRSTDLLLVFHDSTELDSNGQFGLEMKSEYASFDARVEILVKPTLGSAFLPTEYIVEPVHFNPEFTGIMDTARVVFFVER